MKTITTTILLAFAFIHSNAQISYADVKPDAKRSCNSSPCDNEYNIDLNNDGINDFVINATEAASFNPCPNHTNVGVYITSLDSNSVVTYNSHPLMLILNTPIYNQSVYTLNSPLSLRTIVWILNRTSGICYGVNTGLWLSDSDGYIGLKLKKGNNVYYGWIRLSVSVSYTSASFTIKDYAYNSVPNQPILAGEKSCTSPSVTLSASGPLSFCAGDSVILTANGTGYLYQWKKNGVNITGATSQTYIAKNAGIYKCSVTNSCRSKTSKSDTITISCKGISNAVTNNDEKIISSTIRLQIAPNPFSNSTNISFTLTQSQKISLSIYDMTGRLIKVLTDAQMQAGTHQLVWNAKDEKGNAVRSEIYLLKLQAGNYSETIKLVVMK